MANTPTGVFSGDDGLTGMGPQKSLEGFRREELRTGEKQFVEKEPILAKEGSGS